MNVLVAGAGDMIALFCASETFGPGMPDNCFPVLSPARGTVSITA